MIRDDSRGKEGETHNPQPPKAEQESQHGSAA